MPALLVSASTSSLLISLQVLAEHSRLRADRGADSPKAAPLPLIHVPLSPKPGSHSHNCSSLTSWQGVSAVITRANIKLLQFILETFIECLLGLRNRDE